MTLAGANHEQIAQPTFPFPVVPLAPEANPTWLKAPELRLLVKETARIARNSPYLPIGQSELRASRNHHAFGTRFIAMPRAIRIPVMRAIAPSFDSAAGRLRDVDASGRYSNFGPQESELRSRFGDFFGCNPDQIMLANNATSALTGVVATSPASVWTVPSFTFPASPCSILAAGKQLHLVDIGEDWWLSDDVPATAAVMPVAPFGDRVDIPRWASFPHVVFDAAASIGAGLKNLDALGDESAVVFSLHATKVLGSGEGAVVVFGSPDYAETFKSWSNFGFAGTRESTLAGVNGKMSEVQACYVHAALDSWEREKDEWLHARELVEAAQQRLGLEGPPGHSNPLNPYWVVSLPDERVADAVEKELSASGIGSRRWWSKGCHRMEAFKQYQKEPCGTTEKVAGASLGLPIFRGISPAEVGEIEAAVARVLEGTEQSSTRHE